MDAFETLLTSLTLAVGTISAFLIGASKTGVPGVGLFACLLMLSAFPEREMFASGAVVPLLILGDVAAVWYYRKDCDAALLRRLFPPVAVGLIFGSIVVCFMGNAQFKLTVGILATSILVFEFVRKRAGWTAVSTSRTFRLGCGVFAGLTTILGNAAGAVSAAYFASQNLDKKRFMGTNAVFFFFVNVSKVPLLLGATATKSFAGLGPSDAAPMNGTTFLFTLIFAPGLLAGAYLGRRLYRAIPERVFVPLVLTLNFIAAVEILISASI